MRLTSNANNFKKNPITYYSSSKIRPSNRCLTSYSAPQSTELVLRKRLN